MIHYDRSVLMGVTALNVILPQIWDEGIRFYLERMKHVFIASYSANFPGSFRPVFFNSLWVASDASSDSAPAANNIDFSNSSLITQELSTHISSVFHPLPLVYSLVQFCSLFTKSSNLLLNSLNMTASAISFCGHSMSKSSLWLQPRRKKTTHSHSSFYIFRVIFFISC